MRIIFNLIYKEEFTTKLTNLIQKAQNTKLRGVKTHTQQAVTASQGSYSSAAAQGNKQTTERKEAWSHLSHSTCSFGSSCHRTIWLPRSHRNITPTVRIRDSFKRQSHTTAFQLNTAQESQRPSLPVARAILKA